MEQLRKVAELTDYLTTLSHSRRQNPRNDLISALVGVVEEGQRLTQEELIANVTILLSAGHETTSNLIGNGLLALLRNPDQMQMLRDHPKLVASAVEEMMRYDNPVQIAYRSAAEDVEIGGKWIRKGQLVNSVLAAGNRDPERFSDPDRFDIIRDEGRHLGFGLGIHFCIGAPLVRLEAQIAFSTILRRLPELHLTTENLDWQEHPISGSQIVALTFKVSLLWQSLTNLIFSETSTGCQVFGQHLAIWQGHTDPIRQHLNL
jgi:cytochrome P450